MIAHTKSWTVCRTHRRIASSRTRDHECIELFCFVAVASRFQRKCQKVRNRPLSFRSFVCSRFAVRRLHFSGFQTKQTLIISNSVRNASVIETSFFDDTFDDMFVGSVPNAVLTALRDDGTTVRIVLTLETSDADGVVGQLTYGISQSAAQAATGSIASAAGDDLSDCSLFIDNIFAEIGARVICLGGFVGDCKDNMVRAFEGD